MKVSRTFATKLQAQEWAAQVERDALAGEYRATGRQTLGATLLKFRSEVVPLRKGHRWEELRLAAFHRRETRLCALPLASVDVSALEAWRDRRLGEVSASTVRREIALLGAVFSQAVRWGLIRENPLGAVQRPVNPPARRRGIKPEECAAIVAQLNGPSGGDVKRAFLLSLETAMRAGEILSLTWDHVNLADRYVTLPRTKNGDSRQVPLSRDAAAILVGLQPANEQAQDEKAAINSRVFTITGPTLDTLFRRARDRAAIDLPSCKTVRFHDARGEAITRLSKRLDVLELARVVGHRNLSSLMFYYRATAAEIAKKLD